MSSAAPAATVAFLGTGVMGAPMARSLARAGLDVAAWTVRRRTTYGRLQRLGVIAACVEAAALDG